MTKRIVVIGSSNTDMVVRSKHLPKPGETVIGGDFLMNPGGKGANQAVAAAKLGGQVSFVARVGDDLFGREAINGFRQHGINVDHLITDQEHPSGVALIMVEGKGENCISVALGANGAMEVTDIDQAKAAIEHSAYLLLQLEIPMEVVKYAVDTAHKARVPVILNPAPAQLLPDALLQKVEVLSPNETETALLTGLEVNDEETARMAARVLRNKGVKVVIITMGSQGAYVQSEELDELIPVDKVKVLDTTAAGDTFNGALTVGLAEGMKLRQAIIFANKAAAVAVTRMGAQSSSPMRDDLD